MPMDNGFDFVSTARHDTYPAIDPSKSNFAGKVVLVTGASKGIGKAISLAFTQANVSSLILLARSDLSAVKAACEAAQRPGQNLKVLTIRTDVTKTADVVAAAQKVKETFGRLDILINNAGYLEAVTLLGESDPADWWTSFEVNVKGTYEPIRAFLPLLIESGGDKTVLNISSVGAHFVDPTFAAYKASKLAVLRLTEIINAEYGAKGVLAHVVHPGEIATDMSHKMPEDFKKRLVDTPEVGAHALTWLVRERREWLAGRYISCQWDVDELLAKRQDIIDGDKLRVRMVV
ncbi:putative oxidoreductase [Fomitopsis betulina]|nr:putative oxidoreductase [Fomitopsis betulina]